jgi:hypothetical protein
LKKEKKNKEKQIDTNHTQEGIGCSFKPVGHGKQQDGKWRRNRVRSRKIMMMIMIVSAK